MKTKFYILISFLVFSSAALGQKTALEYNLSMKAGPQYYDQNFYGTLQANADQMDVATLHSAWAQFMSELGSFMTARRMRLDNLENQSTFNPQVLRRIEFGTTLKSQQAAALEIQNNGRAYEEREFSGDASLYRPLKTDDVHHLFAMNRAAVYVVDQRAQNYLDVSQGAYDWFAALEKAYRYESPISARYDSHIPNRMKSLIGFKKLDNFIGALVWTKAEQNQAYRTALKRALSEKKYLERLLGIAANLVAGSGTEQVLARDLIAQLTTKTGTIYELDRINLASYPISKHPPMQLQFPSKTRELLREHKALAYAGKISCGATAR